MLTNKATCELAVHFKKKEQHMYDFEFIVIEKFVDDTVNNMVRFYSQEGLFGARSYAPSNLTAWTKDPNSIQNIE